jgi:hypothetical protein
MIAGLCTTGILLFGFIHFDQTNSSIKIEKACLNACRYSNDVTHPELNKLSNIFVSTYLSIK